MTIPWVLGAPTEQALRDAAGRLRDFVVGGGADAWDVGRTLATTRPPHAHRAVLLGGGDDFAEPLTLLAQGRPSPRVVEGTATDAARTAFVFPGQGAIWPGMAAELLDTAPVFARRIEECADALAPHVDWSLVDVLRSDAPDLYDQTDVVQPVLFSIMVGLAELWGSYGVRPQAVVGHSIGEVAAACVSGALSLDDAAKTAVLWSRAQSTLAGRGGMAVVALPVHEVTSWFAEHGHDVDVSGVMAPRTVVVSGDREVLALAAEQLRAAGVYAHVTSVPLAAHCPRVEEVRDTVLTSLASISPRASDVPFYSGMAGAAVDTAGLDAEYWYRNLRQPMLFESATRAMLADGYQAFVEVTAHPVLTLALRQTAEAVGAAVPVLNSLKRDEQRLDHFLISLAEAHVQGLAVDWEPVLAGRGRTIDLPDLDAPADSRADATPAKPAGGASLANLVSQHVADVLGIGTELRQDDYEKSLFELGCTSVQLIRLQSGLARELGVSLESTFIIDHPTANALTDELTRRVDRDRAPAEARSGPVPAAGAFSAEPIAVVGMAFRLPGGIGTRDQLWETLSGKVDVVREVPADRWSHSDLDTSEVTTTQGGYLDQVDGFDPLFFNISPTEAESIDPQQRLLLELTWEALEDAGMDPTAAGRDRRVGVFVGIYTNDYVQVAKNLGHPAERYSYTGNMANSAAGRISYTYGFEGPSHAIDAACASSLYALHQAGRELQHGGCDMVVAAAVNLILSPEGHVSWSRLQALSPTGRCRSFDNGADGYIRSEGGTVVVLKRLSDAERDGDDILAVIRGSAINHNGQGGGFTVPSGTAQQRVVEAAMAEAGVGIEDVDYVEAHGSGTPIGDPQEVNALARVFAGRREKLRVGSVKSNLGHLESAAGMAALCKVIVSMRHGRLPATLHFREGNRLIDWDAIPIEVVADEVPWEPVGDRRRAGISSFGINGSNAHMIVEEYEPKAVPARPTPGLARLLPVSAKSEPALRTALSNLAEWSEGTTADLADIAHTLGERRAALRHRAALVCDSVTGIPAAVETALGSLATRPTADPGQVFVFSGQGTQYPGMARELYEHAEVFRDELDEIDRVFRRIGDVSPIEAMFGDDEAPFRSPRHTQAMIFAVELALARYWQALGVTPSAVIGHSIGEYAAACFASVMSLTQAVDLVTRRARVVEASTQDGSMATLLCSRERAEQLLADFPDVSVAAVNAAENTTIAGATESLAAVLKAARRQRIFTERLDVTHPYHSAQMTRAADDLHEQIRHHAFDPPALPWISAVTGAPVPADSPIDASYWSRHLVEPVLFRAAVGSAIDGGARVFLEIGATATVGGLVAQEFADTAVVLPSLRKGRSDTRQLLESAAVLWELGRSLEWGRLPGGGSGTLVRDLPRTPFDRRRTWYSDSSGQQSGEVVARPVAVEQERTGERRMAEREVVVAFVKQSISQVTGVAVDAIDESVQLFALGIDSLMLVQLGKRVEVEYSLDIPIKAFFESLYTPGLLADFVLEHRPAEAAPLVPAEPTPSPQPGAAVAPVAEVRTRLDVGAAAQAPGIEGIIRSQLEIMQQQLDVLAGATTSAEVQAPAPKAKTRQAPEVRKVGTYTNNIELVDDRLTPEQAEFIRDFVARFTAKTPTSKVYAGEHREVLADWIASLNFNPSIKETVYPVVSARSSGAKFWDVDGNEYIDTAMGYGVHFFGHQPDFIVDAVREQLDRGYELGPQNRVAGEVAELVHEMTGAERVAFCNTGTEAVMVSVRLARAVSGRDKVARFLTSFHGSYDAVLAEADGEDSIPTSIGIPQSAVDDTIVLTYGSPESLDRLRRHGAELAAVLVEPVQSRNPALQPTEFLRELREICTEHGIALIFDEMIVGFRAALGGAQEYFGVESDMSLYGKLVGGGMPIGIIAGKSKYLDAVDGGAWSDVDDSKPAVPTTFFAGTFCKHPLTMAACKAALTRLRDHGAEELTRVNQLTADFARRVNDYFEAEEVPLKVAHFSSLYRYETVVPRDMSQLSLTLNLFFKLMVFHGVYVWERRTAFFSLAHTREHQDRIFEVIRTCVEALRAGGFDFRRSTSTAPRGVPSGTRPVLAPIADTAVSEQEKRVYVLSRMRGGNEAYQIVTGLRFDGVPDRDRIVEAFGAIARKHEKLRGYYEIDATDIKARVAPEVTPEFHVFDHASDPALRREDVIAVMNRPFDLANPPLWRCGIVIDADGTHHLLLSLHHIIADGGSLDIILDDLADHLTRGELADVRSDGYPAFVRQQARSVGLPAYEEHRRWWLREFETVPPPLSLPTDSPYPLVNDFSGTHHYFRIDDELHQAAKAVIERHRTTPFIFYLSLWSVLLANATGSDDLCVGIPLDQRIIGSFDDTVGMFAQSLPLRIRPTADTRVPDLLQAVRDTSLAAVDHSSYSYDVLVQELDLDRDFGRNALFDVMFTFTNARERVHRFGDVEATSEDFGVPRSMFALSLELTERDGGLFGDLNFSGVYGERRMTELVERYVDLIARVVREPDQTVDELSRLDDETRDRLLTWGTGPVVADVPPLAELFDTALRDHAGRPAIRFGGEDITYAELDERVDRYAGLLRGHGLGERDLVGLLLPPSAELVTLMLAVNRIGAAWLPMDVKDPAKRLRLVIDTAEPKKVVCTEALAAAVDLGDRALVPPPDGPPAGTAPAATPSGADDLAYVIFTSGSTGTPKGVTVTNGSLANFLVGMPEALGWAEHKAVGCLTTPSFDIFLLETLLTLAKGGTVVVAGESEVRTPADIAAFVAANGVEYLQMTPTRLRLLFADPEAARTTLARLEKLIVGGEGFPEDLLPQLAEHGSLGLYNVYGPTETCIWSSVKDLTGATGPVTIGTPIANTTFYVLDDNLRLVPEGTAGNLWIGGLGVSPGYLHRPELTRERFRENPFGYGRIYLSGDRALWQGGEVHCLGRVDDQVKIRGYRVELAEIELAITGHDLVTGAAVIVQQLPSGSQVIRGFYQVREGAYLAPEALRDWLAERLTDYMVPATLSPVADIPMTTSGKVDRKTLEARADQPVETGRTDEPRTGVAQELVAAWRKVLGDIPIGYDESFFDLGGNSFSLVLLLEELHRQFPGMLDVSDLFANPTIGKLQKHLESRLARQDADALLTGFGVRLPESWFTTDATDDGRVEAALPKRTRATLERLRAGGAHDPADLAHVALAVTLNKVLGEDEVSLCVVADDGRVAVVRFDFAGKADLAEVLDDYRRQLDGNDRLDLERFVACRGVDRTVSISCGSARQLEEADLLGHFDVVFAIDVEADPVAVRIDYAREVDPARVEQLLGGHVKLLGILAKPASKEKVQS
ncbi:MULTISPECIES: hybrid non-ribosomal peptide synthetase/type I polyketide synthase [Saccharothrix]|uniref:hybrid non-ribosomal peptide synthetase/type I polyketide synthase n=1 Tax=Saccharothrix TaxID=2071 RepID=UPI00093FC491|nr:hybrid non-ribosomal peptide synthetase/type I polyketide synthase [Saccharothrix sp. CB00851]OKI16264.1 non-ribosomal peptide synthetase [Saccharothrix sp. CB00851]